MSNGYNFYMQRYPYKNVAYPQEDIEEIYTCQYCKFSDFFTPGQTKNIYTESFAEEDGIRVYSPENGNVTHDSYECQLVLNFIGDDCLKNLEQFIDNYMGRKIEYYDTFRKKYASLIMQKEPKVSDERLYSDRKYVHVEFTFTNFLGKVYNESLIE